jgi:hypothetical protein
MVRSGADRTHPEAGKRSFAFDLVSDRLSLLGGVRKVKFRYYSFFIIAKLRIITVVYI